MMKAQDLKYFRDLLTSWLEDLLKQGDNTVCTMVDSTIIANDTVDQASLKTDRSLRLRLRDRESKLINKIGLI
jgi:DnaK suppressor protein